MKLRQLPAVKQSFDMGPDGPAYRASCVLDVVKMPGFQFILQAINDTEFDAIQGLRHGFPSRPDVLIGIANAAETIRKRILSLIPEETTIAESEPEEEFESPYLSSFDIPPPSGV